MRIGEGSGGGRGGERERERERQREKETERDIYAIGRQLEVVEGSARKGERERVTTKTAFV